MKPVDFRGRILGVSIAVVFAGSFVACAEQSVEKIVFSAKAELEKKNSQAAIIHLKNALQKSPEFAEARFLLGRALLEAGSPAEALVELQKAQDLGHSIDETAPLLAKALLEQNAFDKVISQYGAQKLSSPQAQGELSSSLAFAYLAKGKVKEAEGVLSLAVKEDPSNVALALMTLRIKSAQGDLAAARSGLKNILELAPKNGEAWKLNGDDLLRSGKQEDALVSYRKAIQFEKNNLWAHSAAMWIVLDKKDMPAIENQFKELKSAFPRHPQTKFFGAYVALEKGDVKSAEEQSLQLSKLIPDSAQALQLAGTIDLRRGNFRSAQTTLSKAVNIYPSNGAMRIMLAQALLRTGESDRAIKVLEPMLEVADPQWEPNALMGQALLMQRNADKAAMYFSQAAKLNPMDYRSRTALAMAHLAKGQTELGIEELRKISASDPSSVADMAMISHYLKNNDVPSALQSLGNLEKKQAQLPMASNLRGEIEMQLGHAELARQAFQAALKIDPSYFPASAGIAALDVAAGKPELARQRFEAIIASEPHNIRASMALYGLLVQNDGSGQLRLSLLEKTIKANPTEIAPRLTMIKLRLDRKEVKLALAAAQDGLASIPDSPDIHDALAVAQNASGDFNQAVITYTKMAALKPPSPNAYMGLAKLYLDKGDPSAAASNLKKALLIRADFLPAQLSLVLAELQTGRPAEAVAVAKTVQAQHRNNPLGYELEGNIEVSQRNWPAAVKAYRIALDKKPVSQVAIKLHRAMSSGGQGGEAKKLEIDWITKHPKDAVFVRYLGDEALANAKFELAQKHYETAVELNKNDAVSLNNIAWILNRSKNPAALDFALRASNLEPKNYRIFDTLSAIYADKGDFSKAIEVQIHALELSSDQPEMRFNLAKLYVRAGDKKLAKDELARLSALGDKFKAQAELRALLGRL